jgi:hypothetical protein
MRRAPEVSLELTKTHLVIRIPIKAQLVPIAEKLKDRAGSPPYLPPQTLKVFEGVRKGLQNKEIASNMNISERTVKFHVTEIFQRLGITGRAEILKRFGYSLMLLFALFLMPLHAQDKTSKVFSMWVGHTVMLTWTASTSSGVTSYNIYSSASSGGPYTILGSTSGCCSFQALNLVAGNTYYFVATAVAPPCVDGQDVPCGESIYSNEAMATLPTP